MSQTEFLTVAELAKVLKVSESTVYEWTKKGRLRAVRLGRKTIRFRLCDALEDLQKR